MYLDEYEIALSQENDNNIHQETYERLHSIANQYHDKEIGLTEFYSCLNHMFKHHLIEDYYSETVGRLMIVKVAIYTNGYDVKQLVIYLDI